jgi:hypothetical protein
MMKTMMRCFVLSALLAAVTTTDMLAAERLTLASILKHFEGCGLPFLGASITVITQRSAGGDYLVGTGVTTPARCLDLRSPRIIAGRRAGPSYLEFNGSGRLQFGTNEYADFQLRLSGGPPFRTRFDPNPSLGELTLTFNDGSVKTLRLPADMDISQNGRFIQGDVDSGTSSITILVLSLNNLEGGWEPYSLPAASSQ